MLTRTSRKSPISIHALLLTGVDRTLPPGRAECLIQMEDAKPEPAPRGRWPARIDRLARTKEFPADLSTAVARWENEGGALSRG
jgi:hypothetical protein